jgi:integral membrane sensor domain MASE1
MVQAILGGLMLRALLDRKAPLNSLADWIRFARSGLSGQSSSTGPKASTPITSEITQVEKNGSEANMVQAILGGLMLRALLDRKAPLNSLADWIRFALASVSSVSS